MVTSKDSSAMHVDIFPEVSWSTEEFLSFGDLKKKCCILHLNHRGEIQLSRLGLATAPLDECPLSKLLTKILYLSGAPHIRVFVYSVF